MDDVAGYLDLIVEPTLADFMANSTSMRHAYLACVTTYHAIDRAGGGKAGKIGNLKKEWRQKSVEFAIVDMLCHHLKHIQSDDEKAPPSKWAIPLPPLVFVEPGIDIHHLPFIVRDAIKFIRQQTTAPHPVFETPMRNRRYCRC